MGYFEVEVKATEAKIHLVKAKSKKAAVNAVVKAPISARSIGTDAVLALRDRGVEVEIVGQDVPVEKLED